MKTTEIVGYKRTDIGSKYSKRLREEGSAPCVLYGGEENIHFHAPMYLFKELLYTPHAYFVNLNVEGTEYRCILKEAQFHPVSDMIMHVDFYQITDDKEVTMEIPVSLTGNAPGVLAGGIIYIKTKKVKVKALPKNMPEEVVVNIDTLDLGKSMKVKHIEQEDFTIMNNPQVTIVTVLVPRALKTAAGAEEDIEEEEEAEAAE